MGQTNMNGRRLCGAGRLITGRGWGATEHAAMVTAPRDCTWNGIASTQSQPFLNPARLRPAMTYGHARISRQGNSDQ